MLIEAHVWCNWASPSLPSLLIYFQRLLRMLFLAHLLVVIRHVSHQPLYTGGGFDLSSLSPALIFCLDLWNRLTLGSLCLNRAYRKSSLCRASVSYIKRSRAGIRGSTKERKKTIIYKSGKIIWNVKILGTVLDYISMQQGRLEYFKMVKGGSGDGREQASIVQLPVEERQHA